MRSRKKNKTQLARQLRQCATTAERKAWELLRDRRMLGLKFRRQHTIHGFVADFFCHDLRLVLEIVGSVHSTPERIDYDLERDAIFRGLGLTVIHVANDEVTRDHFTATLLPIARHHVPPSPGSGEGDRG